MLTVHGERKQANAALWTKAAMDMNFAGESEPPVRILIQFLTK